MVDFRMPPLAPEPSQRNVAETRHKKINLALEQLDEAIRQFLDRKSYVSALTLAGAAEEILGRTVELRGGESSLAQRVKDHLMIHNALVGGLLTENQSRWRENFARNAIKHLDRVSDEEIELDLEEEALQMLSRAIHNLILLELPYTDQVQRFDIWYMETCVGNP